VASASVGRVEPLAGERVDGVVDAGVKSDIRGLVTAGRTVLLERIAGLVSSVINVAGQRDCS
jgi:hypothetical protein